MNTLWPVFLIRIQLIWLMKGRCQFLIGCSINHIKWSSNSLSMINIYDEHNRSTLVTGSISISIWPICLINEWSPSSQYSLLSSSKSWFGIRTVFQWYLLYKFENKNSVLNQSVKANLMPISSDANLFLRFYRSLFTNQLVIANKLEKLIIKSLKVACTSQLHN